MDTKSLIYLDTQMSQIFNKVFSRIKTEHEHESSSFHDYLHNIHFFLHIQNELEVKNTPDPLLLVLDLYPGIDNGGRL